VDSKIIKVGLGDYTYVHPKFEYYLKHV